MTALFTAGFSPVPPAPCTGRKRVTPVVFLFLAMLAGCSAEVARRYSVLTPQPPTASRKIVVLSTDAVIALDTGYSRTLRRGSRWIPVGTLAEGRVYKPQDGVFTVEGANVHEAYLVIDQTRLVGFFLSVERAFVPLTFKSTLQFTHAGEK